LEALKMAREYNCPWDYHTILDARKNGHMEVVQWALDNGCPQVLPGDEFEEESEEEDAEEVEDVMAWMAQMSNETWFASTP
jgi:hypothetical protein